MPASPERPARRAILLVEDNDLLRRACTIALQRAHYRVVPAPDGERALDLLNDLAESPDVLIVDMRLPDMSGTTLVCRAGLAAAVLYISGDERTLAEVRRVARPIDATLVKPFSLDDLLACVGRLLREQPDPETDPEPDVA